MEEQLPSVKRGDWMFVEDFVAVDGCVVVVTGVAAVIRRRLHALTHRTCWFVHHRP
jgi:hypothetical protein